MRRFSKNTWNVDAILLKNIDLVNVISCTSFFTPATNRIFTGNWFDTPTRELSPQTLLITDVSSVNPVGCSRVQASTCRSLLVLEGCLPSGVVGQAH